MSVNIKKEIKTVGDLKEILSNYDDELLFNVGTEKLGFEIDGYGSDCLSFGLLSTDLENYLNPTKHKIAVVGYNSYEDHELTYIIDFVDTVEEAQAKDDSLYHEKWVYTDFLNCTYKDGKHYLDDEEYKLGDILV